ncbi:sorting and assembly machinery component 50 homolog A isoform X6 [Ostrinia furnacalis]|uniref:sorting and assembly machinery component 50 homolog A isoform X3 n=1 Tax=Ostrinia furnacalis TaxID=93504 RepID=UPI001039D011|nr:sorting and assembly machinery component 50 homolog A isoform X3 [Ostrinia furnacalis]XP_028169228.1 sorting and assembly machinery component 50 homolog A isoform X5 [Ostrinia furnacalis]XP_028169229.1 sorting and assembly machinery component 50 homolog A isoform X6 [Ostrinia furnacalis]
MGTVHAKAADNSGEVGGGLFEFDEPIDLDEEPIPKPTIKLDGVRARVDRVHVDGLNRTKDDIIKSTVDELFHATDFEDVIMRAHKVRRALDAMGCFRDIGVFIDVSSGPGATPEGLEVTFQVKELSRIVGGVNTTVSENEGNLVLGVKMPNVAGRGERLAAEYSMGYRSSSNFSLQATKPYPHKPLVPVVSATVYQQNHEYPWSGYRLLDRGLLLDLAFKSAQATKHNIQWEGLVRDTSVLSKTTSFRVRESSGPQMKSVIRHIVSVDHRDEGVFPTRGSWVQFASELAGLGGGVAHLKTELHAQANVPVADTLVVQLSGAAGVLHDVFGTELADHFFLGGPTSLRGFRQRGVGPHCDGQATGGRTYWAAGLHVFGPLPFASARNGIAALFRSHAFLNMGCLAHPEESTMSTLEALSAVRISCGAGVALRVGRAARLELNYCVPLKASAADVSAPGLQFGVGATFL